MRRVLLFITLLFMAGCIKIRPINLPDGITYLKDIDSRGLQYPLWSPDGKKIVASYYHIPMDDFPSVGRFRNAIVIIDTETWKTTIQENPSGGSLRAEAWTPDNKRIGFYWDGGPDGCGIYVMENINYPPTLLFRGDNAVVSPNLQKVATIEKSLTNNVNIKVVKITDIQSNQFQTTELAFNENSLWYIYSWSPDTTLISLVNEMHTVFLLDMGSSKLNRFTSDSISYKWFPTFSPNGKLIVYRDLKSRDNEDIDQLIISRLDKSCEWAITIKDIDHFAWSPDGDKLFLTGNDGTYLADLKVLFGNDFPNSCPTRQ